MLAFKSVSILWGVLALLVWMRILKTYFNPRAAWLFGILYVFASQPVTGLSSMVLGDHAETLLLSALSVLLFFQLREPDRPKKMGTWITFGLLAGFSLWFAYIYAVTLAAFIVYSVLTERTRLPLKFLTAGALSFCAGFSLWGFFCWKNHFQSFMVQGAPLWESISFKSLAAPLYSWKAFFGARIFFEMRHRPLSGSTYGVILAGYFIVLAGAFMISFTKSKQNQVSGSSASEKIFPIYLTIHAVACQLYDDIGLRYLLPAYPFAIAWLAARFSRFPKENLLPLVLVACLAVTGIVSTVWRFSPAHAGEFLKQRPYAEVPPVFGEINR